MEYRREYTPAAYGADYTRNLRWRYRTRHGEGSYEEPILMGGSFGRGYRRAGLTGPRDASPPPRGYGREYGRSRRFRGPSRRPGTAARESGRAYPYFGSAAAVEAAQGYPPGDTLSPETYPRGQVPWSGRYGEEY
jgi:hypothetical protein